MQIFTMTDVPRYAALRMYIYIFNIHQDHPDNSHSHGAKDEMSPTKSFCLSKLTKNQSTMLKKASRMKRPAAVLTPKKTVAKVVGGDNFSETDFSRLKRSLRRVNKVGRMSPKMGHVDPLAKASG